MLSNLKGQDFEAPPSPSNHQQSQYNQTDQSESEYEEMTEYKKL